MVGRALQELSPATGSLVMIENVGNLVCPALFDLGERAQVVIASVTEGEDKPLKYPHMFRAAELMLLNKVDLLPHLHFDVDRFTAHVRLVNPSAKVIQVSATSGDGFPEWYRWLAAQGAPVSVRPRTPEPSTSGRRLDLQRRRASPGAATAAVSSGPMARFRLVALSSPSSGPRPGPASIPSGSTPRPHRVVEVHLGGDAAPAHDAEGARRARGRGDSTEHSGNRLVDGELSAAL